MSSESGRLGPEEEEWGRLGLAGAEGLEGEGEEW